MGKAKKKWKKQAPDAQFELQVERERERKEIEVKDLEDNLLFTLDFDKKSAKKARMTLKQKLRAKQLKDQQKKISKTEKVLRQRAKKKLQEQAQKMNRTGARNYDIWDGSEIEPKINKKKMQFIEFTKDKQIPLPSVLKPLPGQSYNPSAKDYEVLTQKVIQMKLNDLQKMDQIKSKLYPGSYKSQIKNLNQASQDDSQEQQSYENHQRNEEKDSDNEYQNQNEQNLNKGLQSELSSDTYSDYFSEDQNQLQTQQKQITNKKDIAKVTHRKTKKQKLKKHLNKLKQQQEKQQRMRLKLLKQIPGIPSMVGQLQKQKRQNELRKRDKAKKNQQLKELEIKGQIIKPKRLGKHMYKEQIPVFKLLDQIPGNLRQSTVAQSLIQDRFDSLMRLGKTEVRWEAETGKRSQAKSQRVLKNKLKKKQYEKTTGFSDRKVLHQASAKDLNQKKEKGIFY